MNKYPYINAIYKHYKGGEYQVLTMAKHSETDEDMVIYKSIHFGSYHVRPLSVWNNEVTLPGDGKKAQTVRRFEFHKAPPSKI